MEKEVTIDEKFTLPMLFEEISKGDVYKILGCPVLRS